MQVEMTRIVEDVSGVAQVLYQLCDGNGWIITKFPLPGLERINPKEASELISGDVLR